MLRFTPEQELAINQARAAYNQTETALAAQVAAAGGPLLIGNAAPIPIDAWRRIDQRGAMIMRDVLAVYNTLAAANTTPIGVGDIVSYFGQVSDSGEVSVSLDGRHTGKSDQANVKMVGTPVPVITSEARFGWRQMEVLRKGGMAVDAESIANSQRKVAEKLEDMVLNGDSSVVVNGAQVFGLRNHPNRNTGTHGLTLASATGAQWLAMFNNILAALVGDNAYGRATMFLAYSDWLYISVNEFTAGYPKTILQRLQEIAQVERIIPASKIPANNVCAVAGVSSGEWGSILSAMPMTTAPKMRVNTRDDYVFEVVAMTAPQLRTDFDGRMPVAHWTAA